MTTPRDPFTYRHPTGHQPTEGQLARLWAYREATRLVHDTPTPPAEPADHIEIMSVADWILDTDPAAQADATHRAAQVKVIDDWKDPADPGPYQPDARPSIAGNLGPGATVVSCTPTAWAAALAGLMQDVDRGTVAPVGIASGFLTALNIRLEGK